LIILCTKSSHANPAGRGGADEGARAIVPITNKFLAQDDKDGALPTLYAATQDLPGASYVVPTVAARRRAPRPSWAARLRPATRWPPAACGRRWQCKAVTVELRAATAAHLHNELKSGILVPYS
jgi:hypothetical protein